MISTDKRLFQRLQVEVFDYCTCGRSTATIHCPACGSTDVRVSKRESKGATTLLPTGQREPVRVFNCRRCATPFQEDLCFRTCRAIAITWRSENKVVETLTPKPQEQLSAYQKSLLKEVVKKRPHYRQVVLDRIAEQGPGLLERADVDRGAATAPPNLTVGDASVAGLFKPSIVDSEAAKLFQPAVVDEEDSHGKT